MIHHTDCPFTKTKDIVDHEYEEMQKERAELGLPRMEFGGYWNMMYDDIIEEQLGKDIFFHDELPPYIRGLGICSKSRS